MQRHLLVLAILIGCGNNNNNTPDAFQPQDAGIDAPALPVFRNPVGLPDDQLAQQALAILGADVPNASASCNSCHAITRQHLRYWRALGDGAMSNCLTDLQVQTTESAKQMLNCLRAMPDVETSDIDVHKLGIFASAARLPWFDYTFWKAYGPDAAAQKANFINVAAMPHGDTVAPLTQPQFDIVAEWFIRGQPQLDVFLAQDPAPTTCTPDISSDVAAHVAALSTTGWRSINADNAMNMYDCGGATDAKGCLADKPLGNTMTFGTGWDVAGQGKLRVLRDVTYQSSYWTRSSPDGRFVAHGNKTTAQSTIIDLQRDVEVTVSAKYDPGFFPDNQGFVLQGGTRNTCPMSVLTSNPSSIAMTGSTSRRSSDTCCAYRPGARVR